MSRKPLQLAAANCARRAVLNKLPTKGRLCMATVSFSLSTFAKRHVSGRMCRLACRTQWSGLVRQPTGQQRDGQRTQGETRPDRVTPSTVVSQPGIWTHSQPPSSASGLARYQAAIPPSWPWSAAARRSSADWEPPDRSARRARCREGLHDARQRESRKARSWHVRAARLVTQQSRDRATSFSVW